MYVKRIEVHNFRLLEDVSLSLDEKTTVIIGRNNSGKTSLTELIRRLLSDKGPSFHLEDFSLHVHEHFLNAYELKKLNRDEEEIRSAIPYIEVKFIINYESDSSDFGLLGEFIIDLNPECCETLVAVRYQINNGEINSLFDNIVYDQAASDEEDQRREFYKIIRERIPNFFSPQLIAIDPNDITNQKKMNYSILRELISSGFITAQRGLDDNTNTERDVLGKVLVALFKTANSDLAEKKDREVVHNLENSLKKIQESIDRNFKEQLCELLPAFSLFGYPGLSDPKLCTETTLDMDHLLTSDTKLLYSGINGVNLPETYSGLGVRNLIYILLKVFEFFKSYKNRHSFPAVHLIFIEEPEVHLHPQMQEVFIRQISIIADVFSKEFNNGIPWPVQFIVTTHSTHIANESPFKSMRYFFASPIHNSGTLFKTKIKDLQIVLSKIPTENQEFLHRYMTLTRCDLLFADKAVLIEGTSERLLFPKIRMIVDEGLPPSCKLSSQYISIVEIGGAFAHRFFKLLDFLEIPTLIITDLDAVRENTKKKLVACRVSEGKKTSNGCLKEWFKNKDISPYQLIKEPETNKIRGSIRLAYQVPKNRLLPCGRSFEDAFILENSDFFELKETVKQKREIEAYNKAKEYKKSDFALEFALGKKQWVVPRYITEGLIWLAKTPYNPSLVLSSNLPEKMMEKSNE